MRGATKAATAPRSRPKLRARPKASTRAEEILVLVVDDFEDNRAMYAEYLRFSGLRVAEARNGVEAVQMSHELLPDVVIMDLSLPVMDGWEATRRLKADLRTRAIPVVALTGHALGGHSEKALAAGCEAFLAKPCLPEKLLETVRGMLHKARTTNHKRRK